MKKTILGLLVVLSFSTVVACGGNNTDKNATTQTEKATVNDIDVDGYKKLIKEKPGIVLDVRTPGELTSGIVEGAVTIDIFDADFATKASKLDKTKPIYVYCKVGGRSSKAAKHLVGLGYTQVFNVVGGMDGWKSKGYPTVTPK